MDFNIPLVAGQSVLVISDGPDGAETKNVDKFTSCVGTTGTILVVASSKLGISSAFVDFNVLSVLNSCLV